MSHYEVERTDTHSVLSSVRLHISLYRPNQEEFACKLMLGNCFVPESNVTEHFVPFRRLMTPYGIVNGLPGVQALDRSHSYHLCGDSPTRAVPPLPPLVWRGRTLKGPAGHARLGPIMPADQQEVAEVTYCTRATIYNKLT